MKKIIFILVCIFISGCTNFKPVLVEGWTDECNVMATIGKLEEQDKEKKLAALALAPCYKSIKRRDCRREHYGINPKTGAINPVNYSDAVKYRNYTQCMAEKD